MIEFLDLLFFGPEIEGLQKGIAPLLIGLLGAAPGLAQGIIGGGKRREEEGNAKRQQAQAESDYFNFDFNQDVGPIKNIYSEQAQKQEDYLTRQTQQAGANQLQALQGRRGGFGATQALLGQQTQATQQNELRIGQIRQAGAQFVEQQRQSRIEKRYSQAATQLGRQDHRLAAARRARQQATESIIQGVGSGLTAGLGAASAGKGASFSEQLKASGLIPGAIDQSKNTGAYSDFTRFANRDFGTIG